MTWSKYWREFFGANLEDAEDFKFVSSFNVELNRKRSAPVRDCCVLDNYDRIISDALEKQNRNGKKTLSLILGTNVHRLARASQ